MDSTISETAILTVPVFSTLCNEAFRLRREVFVNELKVTAYVEMDADDFTATHVVAIGSGEICGKLRVIHAQEQCRGRKAVARVRSCQRHNAFRHGASP